MLNLNRDFPPVKHTPQGALVDDTLFTDQDEMVKYLFKTLDQAKQTQNKEKSKK